MSTRGGVLDRRARTIISYVDKYFESEKNEAVSILNQLRYDQIMLKSDGIVHISPEGYSRIMQYINKATKVTERVNLATKVNKNTISRVRREVRDAVASGSKIATPKKKGRGKKIVCDHSDLIAFHNIINSIFMRKEVPTLKKIHAAAQKNLGFPGGVSTLRKILIDSLGYKFKKCQGNKMILIQRPNIKAARARYLRRIRENDALGAHKKPVIYLGETSWQVQDKAGIKRWIITHAGGENGFIDGAVLVFKAKQKSGDYLEELNATNFMKWINDKLIPNLPTDAIIVMDNAPHHSVEETKRPTWSSKKAEMHSWLNANNIQYEEHLTRPELYEIIKKNKPPKNCAIDNIFAYNGFEVLRLPPYNYDLNPIEYIWHLMKSRVADLNVEQLDSQIEKLILEAIASITKEDWQTQINVVKIVENQLWEKDMLEDDDNGPFSSVINMGDEDSSQSSDDSDTNTDEDSNSDEDSEMVVTDYLEIAQES